LAGIAANNTLLVGPDSSTDAEGVSMKKLFKIVFYIIISLVLIGIIGGFVAARLVDPNDYKDKIAAKVFEKTGRNLVVKGPIELSFFPWLGVKVSDVQLSNAKGFQPASFASISKIKVRVKIMPLFSKQVELDQIIVKDLTLNLAKNQQGITNWHDLAGSMVINADTAKPAGTSANPKKSAMAFSVAGIDVENANISWIDQQKNQTILLKNLAIKSDAITMHNMREVNVNAQLQLEKLTVAQTELTNVVAKITFKNGILNVDPLNADVYKGTVRGKVVINFQGKAPKYFIDETLSHIDMTQLIKSGRVVGQANVVAHLTSQGEDKNVIMRNLNGDVQFNVQQGALVGSNIPYQIERAAAMLKREPMPPAPLANDRTAFDVLQGTGQFTAGVFSNHDLLMQSSQFKATGEGSANLVTQTLTYRLRFVGLHAITDAKGKSVQEERQTAIPVLVTGTFDQPIVTPDLNAFFKSEMGRKVVEKVQEKIREKFGGGDTKDAVGGLLNQLLK
jgi:uncharacterized protein involved in outer membrane biogenesis